MKPMPANQLDPRVKHVWRINDALWITLTFLMLAVPAFVGMGVAEGEGAAAFRLYGAVVGIGWLMFLIVFCVVLPPIRYARWRYEVSPEYLDIARGIIWRKRFTIPFIRVQNTDTRQGPILRAFGLASVTVSTAADEHEIPGLDAAAADELRDKAAELARLAREDV